MRSKQNNILKKALKFFLIFCFFNLIFFNIQQFPVSAVSTASTGAKYYVGNGSGSGSWHSQGATLTKEYYIYTDWKKSNGPTYIVMCKRSKPSSCTRKGPYSYGHASTLYHKWGTDYFLVLGTGGTKEACWSISSKKPVSKSKCDSISPSGMSTYSVPQGYTKYGDYYLRSYGNSTTKNYIVLYNKNKKRIKTVTLPSWVNEVEDVMVDGDTGIVYFSTLQYVNGKKQVQFHKIAKSAFSDYIKPIKTQTKNNNNSSSSSNKNSKTNKNSSTSKKNNTESEDEDVPVFDGIVETTFFGTIKDDGSGCGVYEILDLVIQILTIGIGILAVIGITIAGIVYLTAGGNTEKATKAKRRLYEIVIGLAIYAVFWALLNFLLPGGALNSSHTCERVDSATSTSNSDAVSTNNNIASTGNSNTASTNNNTTATTATGSKANNASKANTKTPAQRLNDKAIELAWAPGKKSQAKKSATKAFTKAMKATGTDKGESGCRKTGKACGMFVGTVVRAAGIDSNFPKMASKIYPYVKKSSKWKEVSNSSAQPGDIQLEFDKGDSTAKHVSMVVKYNGKKVTAEASLCQFYGIIQNGIKSYHDSKKTFRYIGK